MAATSTRTRKAIDNVVQLPLTAAHIERLVTAYEASAAAQARANDNLAAAAEKVRAVANGFLETGEWLKKRAYWTALFFLTMAQVALPWVKDVLDRMPALPSP